MATIPKKYRDRVDYHEHDQDGWWIYLANGWQDSTNPDCSIIMESTWREALGKLRSAVQVDRR